MVTPTDPAVSAGIVCVDVAGMPPANAVQELRTRGVVASATPYRRSYLRLGPSIATSPEQVDQAIAALEEIVQAWARAGRAHRPGAGVPAPRAVIGQRSK